MAFHELPGKFQVDVADGRIRIAPARPCDLAKCVYHLDFIGPDGKERLVYRTNVLVPPEGSSMPLPLALNDAKGRWTLRIREVATARKQELAFQHN